MRYFIICLLTISLGYAQENTYSSRVINNFSALDTNLSGAWIKNPIYHQIQGTVYLYDNWLTYGVITTNENLNISLKGLNYDTSIDHFVAKISMDSVYKFDNSNIKEVIINKVKFKKYLSTEFNRKVYFQVIAIGKEIEFLKRTTKKLTPGILNPMTQVASPDKYVNKTTYYIFRENELKEMRLRKKAFCKLFGENSKVINKYISDKNLSLNEDRNLQVILNYYNTL